MSNSQSTSPMVTKMHWLVMVWMGVGVLFAASFPLAIWRVSQTPKFTGQAFKSLDCAGQKTAQKTVITSEMCAELVAKPLSTAK